MQAQIVPQELPYLRTAPTDPRQLFDAVARLGDRTRRPFAERGFHWLAVRSQSVHPPLLTEIAYGFQAPYLKDVQQPLDRAPVNACQLRNPLMRLTVTFQPQHLHPPLHAWIRVAISFRLNDPSLVFREHEPAHPCTSVSSEPGLLHISP
jgi:hypothetical protein